MIRYYGWFLKLVFIVSVMCSAPALAQPKQVNSHQIYHNQVGFFPYGKKIAVVASGQKLIYHIRRGDDDKSVFKGILKETGFWECSGENLMVADFSDFHKKGEFYIDIPTLGSSSKFVVSDNCYINVLKSSAKAYYYWRCSYPLEEKFAGKWNRPLGHPDTCVFVHPSAAENHRPAGTKITSSGGWYDAGDYNKYVVNSGISTYSLMAAYEFSPQLIDSLEWNIPESGDSVPDMLNEVYYNLKWLLSMQDPGDGGVYHKLTTPNFAGKCMPIDVKKAKRYVVKKTTGATLNFAAVMAAGSRILKRYYPGFAGQCLDASHRAWRWAKKNPSVYYKQNVINRRFDPDINTGTYNNNNFSDEFAWAASELYVTSRMSEYLHHWRSYYGSVNHVGVPSWGNTSMLGVYTLIRNRKYLDELTHKDLYVLKNHLLKRCDALIDLYVVSPNKTVFGNKNSDFKWGSNAQAANQGMLLLHGWQLTGKELYFEGAQSNLDYILGRNGTGYCFVTGVGHKNPQNPHHRISASDGIIAPVPGLLVGGACNMPLSDFNFPSNKPAKRYIDQYSCYVTNEVAINWNAPLVFLLSGIIREY